MYTWQARSELAAAAAADELPALQARMRCLERDVADLRASHAARSAELALATQLVSRQAARMRRCGSRNTEWLHA